MYKTDATTNLQGSHLDPQTLLTLAMDVESCQLYSFLRNSILLDQSSDSLPRS